MKEENLDIILYKVKSRFFSGEIKVPENFHETIRKFKKRLFSESLIHIYLLYMDNL